MLRHSTGYALAARGMDTRRLQHFLGHASITNTVRYTAMSPEPFKDIWRRFQHRTSAARCFLPVWPIRERQRTDRHVTASLADDRPAKLRALNVTPYVTQNESITAIGKRRHSAIDGRTTRHEGYGLSQSCRAMIECIFGWGKQHGTMRKTKHRGIAAVTADFLLNLIAYDLIRIPKLLAA